MDRDKYMEALRESWIIRCPHCKQVFNDDEHECMTYHGSQDKGEPTEVDCGNCEETFFVNEEVERTYESYKTKAEWLKG